MTKVRKNSTFTTALFSLMENDDGPITFGFVVIMTILNSKLSY